MSNAIGLRFYRVTFHEERSATTIKNDDARLFHGEHHLLSEFISKHTTVTNVDEAQRGWFFDHPTGVEARTVSGRITYGVHGIVSRFVDIVDRKEQFKRKSSHLEEIPLYFQFSAKIRILFDFCFSVVWSSFLYSPRPKRFSKIY